MGAIGLFTLAGVQASFADRSFFDGSPFRRGFGGLAGLDRVGLLGSVLVQALASIALVTWPRVRAGSVP